MKNIIDFLFESRGADIKDRKYSRFFGDELNRPKNLKDRILKTKKFLKDYDSYINNDIKDFLLKLAENKKYSSDSRSNFFCRI